MSKNRTSTHKIELVETGNIALALNRIIRAPGLTSWRRALYHAIEMSDCAPGFDGRKKIREALELP